jgi:hypothetical protein
LIVLTQIINSTLANLGFYNIWFFELSLIFDFIFFYWFCNKWSPFQKWFKWVSFLIFGFIGVMYFLRYFVFHSEKEVNYAFPLLTIYFIIQSSMMIIKTFEKSDTLLEIY